MLPFARRPWAKPVAVLVIVLTILCEIELTLWLRKNGPLNTADIVALVFFFLAVVPPNVHILRLRQDATANK